MLICARIRARYSKSLTPRSCGVGVRSFKVSSKSNSSNYSMWQNVLNLDWATWHNAVCLTPAPCMDAVIPRYSQEKLQVDTVFYSALFPPPPSDNFPHQVEIFVELQMLTRLHLVTSSCMLCPSRAWGCPPPCCPHLMWGECAGLCRRNQEWNNNEQKYAH